MQADLQRTGVNVLCGSIISGIAPLTEDRMRVTLSNSMRIEADQLLWAVGRIPNTQGMGLETAGVRLTERGAVAVGVGGVGVRSEARPVEPCSKFFSTLLSGGGMGSGRVTVAAGVCASP